ncbi:MAG: hypothetical protein KDC95_13520 [Planctomycetes bacterium]|nr:hypothetical protein [Planctomycetota bacterium]
MSRAPTDGDRERADRMVREMLSRFDEAEHMRLVPLKYEGQKLAAKLSGPREPDYSTLWRWATVGVPGADEDERIVLETVCSLETSTCLLWLARFMVERSIAQRKRLARRTRASLSKEPGSRRLQRGKRRDAS